MQYILLAFVINAAAADFISPQLTQGLKFQRREGTAFVKITAAKEFPDMGLAKFSFHIFPKDNPEQKVGFICASYCQEVSSQCEKPNVIQIDLMEIDKSYQRKGYGEAALRTVLGIFRAEKRKNLLFNEFELSVGLGEDRLAARLFYNKIGFTVSQLVPQIGYQFMTLQR